VISRTAKVGEIPGYEDKSGQQDSGGTGQDTGPLATMAAKFMDPQSLANRSFASPAALNEPGGFNNPSVLGVGWPAIAGLATGTGLAGFYRDLIAGRILAPDILRRSTSRWAGGADQVFGVNLSFGLGYLLPCRPLFYVPPQATESVFGHFGAGGGFGLGDSRHGLAIAYVMNGMRTRLADFGWAYRMVEAVYDALNQ
jgi:hypothetical protein